MLRALTWTFYILAIGAIVVSVHYAEAERDWALVGVGLASYFVGALSVILRSH